MSVQRIMADLNLDRVTANHVMESLRGEAVRMPEAMRQRLAEIAASRRWMSPEDYINGKCAVGASAGGVE